MKKRVLSLLMVGVLAGALLTGCGKSDNKAADNNGGSVTQEEKKDDAAAGEGSYTIASSTWGAGAYPLDDIVSNNQYLCNIIGGTLDVANNEFTADKVVSNLENQLANNPDGVLIQTMAQTTFGQEISDVSAKNLPFAFDSNFPEDESLVEKCYSIESFCGGVCSNPYEMGVAMAELAYADGHRTAVTTGAALGDYSHDNRMKGFKETFEKLGGTFLQDAHCADPSEAVAKTNDLLTANPDVDCIYATGGDYLSACATIKESRSDLDVAIYGTDIDPTLNPYIEDGTVTAMNGGQGVCGSIAITLIVNYLDGHQILDADGKAPLFDNLNVFTITGENAAGFQKLYDAGANLVGDDNYKKLLYRYNPDVTIETYNEVLEGYAESVYGRLE